MAGSLRTSGCNTALVAVSLAALAACSGGGGGGYSPGPSNPTPTPVPTATASPCGTNTAPPASGSTVYYLQTNCSTANSVSGFTVPGDAHGMLVAASTVDESVPFTAPSNDFPVQSPPPSDELDVSIVSGESASSVRRTTQRVSQKVDVRSNRIAQSPVAPHFRHPRTIAKPQTRRIARQEPAR